MREELTFSHLSRRSPATTSLVPEEPSRRDQETDKILRGLNRSGHDPSSRPPPIATTPSPEKIRRRSKAGEPNPTLLGRKKKLQHLATQLRPSLPLTTSHHGRRRPGGGRPGSGLDGEIKEGRATEGKPPQGRSRARSPKTSLLESYGASN